MAKTRLLTVFLALLPAAQAVLSSGVFFPLFFDPGNDCSGWNSLIQDAKLYSLIPFYFVVNPAHGPGTASQPPIRYQTCIGNLIVAGSSANNVKVLGYVDTQFGARKQGQVVKDIDRYSGWNAGYRPSGIFFDNTPTDASFVSLYETYANRVRQDFASSSLVVLNPGATPSADYFNFSDIIVTFNTAYDGFSISQIQKSDETPAQKQAVILHDGPLQLGFEIVDEISAIANVKASFITNVTKNDEFRAVPSGFYFSDFCGFLIGSQTA